MDFESLLGSLKNPERERVEFKQSFSDMDDIGKTIASFATRDGGTIFVGIDKKGVPVGTTCSDEIRKRLHELATQVVRPPARIYVELSNFDKRLQMYIVKIVVEKGSDVHAYKGVPLIRDGDTNRVLSTDEVFELKKNLGRHYFDELPALNDDRPAVISDIDAAKVERYLKEVKKTFNNTVDVARFLINNGLTTEGNMKVVNAAVLLFGKRPEDFVPQSKIRLSVYDGTIVAENFKKKVISGDLFEMFEQTLFELGRYNSNHSFVDGTKRIDVPEYPVEALREIVINAIVHRDYFERNTDIFIKVFADRIEITNPAAFPFEQVTFDEIRASGLSKRRNPVLASFFERAGLMEQEGRGLRRVEALAQQHGLPPPVISVTGAVFQVTIFNSAKNEECIKNSPFARVRDFGALNERQRTVINDLMANPRSISRQDYLKVTGLTQMHTATRELQDMVQKGFLKSYGERRGTRYWPLTSPGP